MADLSTISLQPEEIVSFLKKNLQFREVYQKILYQRVINQATAERGITVTPEEIQAEADQLRLEKRLEKASDTLAWLAEQMITPDQWEEGIRDRLLSKKLSESLFAKEVEKSFAQNRISFERVLLYQIVVEDGKVAQELLYQIEEKEISFYEAAKFYDIDENRRQNCGCEGEIDRYQLKPDIVAAVFSGQLGEVVGPLKTEQGYHLLMVEKFIPAELTSQRYQELLDGMFQQWLVAELNYMLHSQAS
ncbi:peptidylprolyl isomerase [Lyngbya aestuarii]|uniref:peptidylprolyl isomerase n=1 Tax=Lyngbya aestuarii TaxID=118322 RepID=UPI00403DDE6A